MVPELFFNTLSPVLQQTLNSLMSAKEFVVFRLVGGTALSLQRGHRISVDIDLFTDSDYDSVDFNEIERWLKKNYTHVDSINCNIIGMGKSFFIGESSDNYIKLDLYYTDKFIFEPVIEDQIRMAAIQEIIAMKVDVICRGGRKKDFWDIHELIDDYSLEEMVSFHKRRYPYSHDPDLIRNNFLDFQKADNDFNPICLRSKHWELIKLDLFEFVRTR